MNKQKNKASEQKQAKRSYFSSVNSIKHEEIMRKSEKVKRESKISGPNEIDIKITSIADIEKRKQLIETAREIIDELDDEHSDGGLLF